MDNAGKTSFQELALELLRMDPRCVHRTRNPHRSSSDPDRIAQFHFGQGNPAFDVTIELPVEFPKAPKGLARFFATRRFEARHARAEEKARDEAIIAIVRALDQRLSGDAKLRLLELLEEVQT